MRADILTNAQLDRYITAMGADMGSWVGFANCAYLIAASDVDFVSLRMTLDRI